MEAGRVLDGGGDEQARTGGASTRWRPDRISMRPCSTQASSSKGL
ncbi:hypothetical protein ACN28S_16530 [Cystobacter fuscus]